MRYLPKREVEFVVHCSKGTYIRSLVNDIGNKIGCGATMVELRRIKTGKFEIENSIDLYEFLKLDYDQMLGKITSIEEYYADAKKVNFLSKDEYTKFLNGVKFDANTQDKIVRIYFNNSFKGLGIVENKTLKRYIIE